MCLINLWNIIKSCTEFANLRAATSPTQLAAHRSRGPRKSILWWNLYFASTGKRHRKAQEVCAQSSSRDSIAMWRASRRAEEQRETRWFRCLNPRSDSKAGEKERSEDHLTFTSSALPLAKQGRSFSESTKFSVFASSTKPAQTWPQNSAGKVARFFFGSHLLCITTTWLYGLYGHLHNKLYNTLQWLHINLYSRLIFQIIRGITKQIGYIPKVNIIHIKLKSSNSKIK